LNSTREIKMIASGGTSLEETLFPKRERYSSGSEPERKM